MQHEWARSEVKLSRKEKYVFGMHQMERRVSEECPDGWSLLVSIQCEFNWIYS